MEHSEMYSPLPQKSYVRRSLTMHNPPRYKSGADGKVYKATGRVVDLEYVKPKGKIYQAPETVPFNNEWEKLRAFEKVMADKLKTKGIVKPEKLSDLAQLFYNHVVGAKGFNGATPVNFESIDNADETVSVPVVSDILNYFKSIATGVQPNGQPLNSSDAKISQDVKNVIADLQNKVATSGLSPQDKAAAGVVQITPADTTFSFFKTPAFKWIAGIVVVLIVISILK